jgi:hypothetical protein
MVFDRFENLPYRWSRFAQLPSSSKAQAVASLIE